MFTDIVGYSALTQQNEARALELLEEHRRLLRPVFSQHGGQEIKTNADEFLVEFGSAVEATRCGIAIQKLLHERNASIPAERKVRTRVGIHVGDVVYHEGDVLGDGVNIAKRIESLAPSGGICFSAQVFDHVRNRIDVPVVSLGRPALKNIRTPVEIYQVCLPWEKRRRPLADRIRYRSWRAGGRVLTILLVIAGVLGVSSLWQKLSVPGRTTGEVPRLKSAPTRDRQALDLYLEGRNELTSMDTQNNERAISLLEQAVAREPNYAEAYALLAIAYNTNNYYLNPEAKQREEKARVAAAKALYLNPRLAEAYRARGFVLWTRANGFPHEQAIRAYRRALALNPNLTEARTELATIYGHIGLFDKAAQELHKELEINPTDAFARWRVGVDLQRQGKYREALEIEQNSVKVRESNPHIWGFNMASTLLSLGRKEEAMALVQQLLRANPADQGGVLTSVRAMLCAAAGDRRGAEQCIQRAAELGKDFGEFHHTEYQIGAAYALMNRRDAALTWLEKAADDGFPCYPWYARDPNLKDLRKDPRFIAFLAKLREQWEYYRRL